MTTTQQGIVAPKPLHDAQLHAPEAERAARTAFWRLIQPPRRETILLAFGFAGAVTLTAIATLLAISGDDKVGGPAGPVLFWLLGASLAIGVALLSVLGWRIRQIARAGAAAEPGAGARLHLRFVALFSAAAVAPAIIVALFLGVALSRAIESGLNERVQSLVEDAASVGRAYVQSLQDTFQGEVEAMGRDLNNAEARKGLTAAPERYQLYLENQARQRLFSAVYVINSTGKVLSKAEAPNAVPFAPIDRDILTEANGQRIPILIDQADEVLRAVHRLMGYDDAFLVAIRGVEPGTLATLSTFDEAVGDYRAIKARSEALRALFALAYLATALLVLLAAVWLALKNATRVAEPIGRLADAARRVADGDLGARVLVGQSRDEIDGLSRAFNRMTMQLESQRADLVSAREDAEDRSRFIQAVLSGVSAGVIGLDPAGRITACNGPAARLLGVGIEMLGGRRLVDVAPEFLGLLEDGAAQAQRAPARIDLAREGATRHLSVRVSGDGAESGLVLTFDDMTKLIAAQRQEAWKDVARRIAHEIRNPLTPIQLSAERLRRKYSEQIHTDLETFHRCTDTILRQVGDIGRMVDEFSAFARMPAPRLDQVDVVEIAREAVFAQRLAHSDISFELEGAAAPIVLWCDGRLIGQALTNLLKNAAEAIQARRASDGEPKDGRVTLMLTRDHDTVVCEIIDNGMGFPKLDRDRLIEPYVTTRARGSGLGLAIVNRVIEDHGGALSLNDAPHGGAGAMVRFHLPLKLGESASSAISAQEQKMAGAETFQTGKEHF
jgi:two-component system nitrogen regulation sensor histidine kinase NtrY